MLLNRLLTYSLCAIFALSIPATEAFASKYKANKKTARKKKPKRQKRSVCCENFWYHECSKKNHKRKNSKNCSCYEKLECVEKHIIHCLPYTITRPGEYCLGKDFTFYDNTKNAINVINTENVVINFNQRKITTNVASNYPLVSVKNSTDVELKNVHLEAVGAGKYLRGGISILDCKNVSVDSPVLLNLDGTRFSVTNCAMSLFSTDGVDVSNLYLKNDSDTTVGTGIAIDNSRNLSIQDSELYNAAIRGDNCQNVDLLRLHIDNTGFTTEEDLFLHGVQFITDNTIPSFKNPVENLRVADCNIKVKGFAANCLFVASGGAGDLFSRNITFENNNLTVINDGARGIRYLSVNGGIIRGNSIDIESESEGIHGIQTDSSSGVTITKNNIRIKTLNPGSLYIGISVEQAPPFIVTPTQTTVLISENNIYKSGPVASYDVGIEFYSALGYFDEVPSLQYNTIEQNNVTGFQYGITDGDVGEPPFAKAHCNIYSNNFSNGNGQNYFIDTSDPVNSIFLDNNVDGCVNPDLVPPVEEAGPLVTNLDVDQYKTKRLEMLSKLNSEYR